ncbi:glycosylhydrolase-like jelly roll fold domain-containing protein [Bacillus sp. FSL K6-3431]|uniref:glycosylhydrolase-like jelly roll fold domain-containing protein n=1 Tax=Bacillus sp. FSL K6-3431 TaxID=2921500 RepID=UPI0030FBDE35
MSKVAEEFLKPSDEFSPIPFWFWNDRFTHEEIKRQIHDFYEKGVNGFVLHPRLGVPKDIEYLSDTYMEFVLTAVKEAKKLGMTVILYDEAMYPSGSAKGMVVKDHPEYASRGLKMVEYPCHGITSISIPLDDGEKLISVQAVEKRSDSQLVKESIKRLHLIDGKIQYSSPLEGNWSIICLVETYTKGTIRGLHYGEDDREEHAPASADLLNPLAVQRFIQLTHERYYAILASYFGSTIQAFFTDEPDMLGRGASRSLKPWTNGFLSYYLKQGNRETDLLALWFDIGNETAVIRKNYQKAVNKRLAEAYYRPLSIWCEEHHISLTGHPAASDDIGLLDYFQIPGQDVVWRWVAPEDEKGLVGHHSTAGKCSADAARHRGRRRNLNEVLGVCGQGNGWNLSGGDMKWYFDWLFVRGVNLISPHAFYYSIEGRSRSHERPPDVGANNIWWPYYKQFSTYIKRLSWLMTDSVNQAQIAVLCEEDFLPWKIVKPLYENQIEFNYLEESLLHTIVIDEGKLCIEKQVYHAILIEDISRFNSKTMLLLENFIEKGVSVFVLSENEIAGAKLTSMHSICENLEDEIGRETMLVPACKNIRISKVEKENKTFYLLINEGETNFGGKLQMKGVGSVQKWDPWKGTIEDVPIQSQEINTIVSLQLQRRESIIIHFNPNEEPLHQDSLPIRNKQSIIVRDDWKISLEGSTLDKVTLESWTHWDGMEHFSGALMYEQTFTCPETYTTSAILDLGEVHEIAQVWINDQEIGVKMWAPYTFEFANLLRKGNNSIKIVVTNSKANCKDEVSLPSGLIGPVTLTMG